MIYLDNNATTRPAPEVIDAMCEALREFWANPSSIHRAGQAARRKLDLARQSVAQLIGCKDRDLIFTSGGTEAANLAILGSVRAVQEKKVIVTTQIEHSAIRETAARLASDGYEVVYLPNDEEGVVEVDALSELLQHRAKDIALVAVMWSNNETGVIQPIERVGAMCAEHNVRFYVDGTQWIGKMPTNVANMPVDLVSFAAHKFHGPKGAGGLYVKPKTRVLSHTIGGPQERQRRGGTENVPGFLGMGVAADLAHQWLNSDEPLRMNAMRERFEQRILNEVDIASVNGGGAQRQWNTSNIAFSNLETETILLMLSERGVCASGGSACASGSLDPSPILKAMNVPLEKALGSVRFSLSRTTTDEEIDQALEIIPLVVERLRKTAAAVAS